MNMKPGFTALCRFKNSCCIHCGEHVIQIHDDDDKIPAVLAILKEAPKVEWPKNIKLNETTISEKIQMVVSSLQGLLIQEALEMEEEDET